VVIYGSPDGLTATDANVPSAEFWDYTDLPPPSGIRGNERLGTALAWGDFNGDDAGDLSIGAPGTFVQTSILFPAEDAGAVWIVFGSRNNGLTTFGLQYFDQQPADVVGRPAETGDHFGQTLAAGDFNGDSFFDLAIGAPDEDIGAVIDAGGVNVFHGSSVGLTSANDQFWHQNNLIGVAEANDRFGTALTTGDFNGDGRSDLAVGVPREDSGALANAGAVNVIHGSSTGLTSIGSQFWDQSTIFGPTINPFTESGNEAQDFFGFALAAGDFNHDGRDDLAIGVPLEDVVNSSVVHTENAGEVDVLYGSAAGLATTGRAPQQFHQDTINVEDVAETNDQFGRSLTAWNFGRNEDARIGTVILRGFIKTPDLAIGVPFEDVGSIADAGAVNVLYGSSSANGLTTANDQFWHQDSAGVPGGAEAGDEFGAALY
jgi:hypothetical protein